MNCYRMYRDIDHHLYTISNKDLDLSGEEAETTSRVAAKLANCCFLLFFGLSCQNTQVVQGDTQRLKLELGKQLSNPVPKYTNSSS